MRLSEFKDEKAVEVVGLLLEPVGNICNNPENKKAKDGGTVAHFAGALLRNNPKDVMKMLAILDDKAPEEYHCTAATVIADVFNMLSDPEVMALFGLQRQTPASSGSASETTKAQKA